MTSFMNVIEEGKKHTFFFGDVRRSNREFQRGWRENGNSEGVGKLNNNGVPKAWG